MSATIRLANIADAAQVAQVYAPSCHHNSPVSFEVHPPDATEMADRIANVLQRYPWLVCENDDQIVGFVNATPHHPRAAYVWSVTTAAYVRNGWQRRGIGRGLYTSLIALLRRQGYFNAYAGITLPNDSSTGLHASLGFSPVGLFRDVGYKAGAWRDVQWWHLQLSDYPADPPHPMELNTAKEQPWWSTVLAEGQAHLRVA